MSSVVLVDGAWMKDNRRGLRRTKFLLFILEEHGHDLMASGYQAHTSRDLIHG